ncbi:rRNA pseudouridine synthase [Eubacteriales bacterium OttesenSCG-928-N13]|nr:rRNA pseudouridine synthase [Eubacteriales bacterium OttesenSCG-928-N13]
MRLDKYLSLQGYTRSQAKRLCTEGRVRVDGDIAIDASRHVSDDARIFLDGAPLVNETHQHLMLHKPQGVITATKDERGKQTVLDLIPPGQRRRELGPVGRLDKDVTGLILLTTDGQLAHRLISPKWVIEKRYVADVQGELTEQHVRRMAEGIRLTDFTARPAKMQILHSGEVSRAELYITEGKYHQVKRMFGALERPVIRLERLSIGALQLDPALMPGEWRALTDQERAALYQAVDMKG